MDEHGDQKDKIRPLFDNRDDSQAVKMKAQGHFKTLMGKIHVISLLSSLGSIAICGGAGYCLDLTLDKKYFWTIIGLIVGFVVMIIVTSKLTSQLISKERERQA